MTRTPPHRVCLEDPIPASAGVGLKPQHYRDVLEGAGHGLWFEVHPENYMGSGGPPHRYLEAIRRDHALSLHSVGGSPGSADGLRAPHLERLKELVDRYQPALVSDHLSWSGIGDGFVHDLLPIPLTSESLRRFTRNIDRLQEALGRTILIENPSLYLLPVGAEIPEPEFIAALCRRTGCGWLLDINNILVSATNLGFDPADYLQAVDPRLVQEIHLAGHAREAHADGDFLIDDHGSQVPEPVWDLFATFLAAAGPRPTLIEWDTRVPDFATLAGEAARANALLAAPARLAPSSPVRPTTVERDVRHDSAA
ncbi:MAG: DUF692 domain-containing protein [Rhodospirillales bacterium]|nr:DUF692 domain-containing protein [Rhodospirillales bacterium]